MFTRLLVANRGEIACRIIATCRRLGIATVAVYSDADAGARHVRLADAAVRIGPAPARESYLDAAAVIAAARATGAQAIHPGYGFLSENAGFARACAAAGIAFVGPSPQAIEAMGSKAAAKTLMQAAGVPLVPGYHGQDQAPQRLREEAARIGWPVLVKASAGGGGKGMRVVEREADFDAALAACRREAAASFGDDRVLLEKYLPRPRHVEVQVFGDAHGNVVHLHERDCSAQRRHQKVAEEAPAPGLDATFRDAIGRAAVAAARAVDYVGAGTVEFIVDGDGTFCFMEMNTRLQVEHPVTEMITGLDLVEWQLRVAAGEPLPLAQDAIPLHGHAIEVRVYAERPAQDFLPATGTLEDLRMPAAPPHVRVDSGVDRGDAITPYYDPMIAKLVTWDTTREAAIARMLGALRGLRIVGVDHNLGFLAALVDHPAFRAGGFDTGLIERELPALLAAADTFDPLAPRLAALWRLDLEARQAQAGDPHDPWARADGWRIAGAAHRTLCFEDAHGAAHAVAVDYPARGHGLRLDGEAATLASRDDDGFGWRLGTRGGHAAVVEGRDGGVHVFTAAGETVLHRHDPLARPGAGHDAQDGLLAPMPGRIVAVHVEAGQAVEPGTPLLVMEAMKMEYTINAPARGRVACWRCAVGDQVAAQAPLLDFEAAP
jgi:3-methylcrotonyl-CoA carboxylase alpha subunit